MDKATPDVVSSVVKPRGVVAAGAGVDAKPVVARHFLTISPTNTAIAAPSARPQSHTPVPTEGVKFPSIRSAVPVRDEVSASAADGDMADRRVSPIELEGKGRSRSTAALPSHRRRVRGWVQGVCHRGVILCVFCVGIFVCSTITLCLVF